MLPKTDDPIAVEAIQGPLGALFDFLAENSVPQIKITPQDKARMIHVSA